LGTGSQDSITPSLQIGFKSSVDLKNGGHYKGRVT